MNVERLHAIALEVRRDLDETGVLTNLQALKEATRNAANSPQEPSYQQAISEGLNALRQSLAAAPSDTFSPLWADGLEELGMADLLGDRLARRISEIFERNQITVSVAADEVDALSEEVEGLDSAINELLSGMRYFDIGSEDLTPGTAEVGVLIPRPAVEDSLAPLGREMVELQRLLAPMVEISTGGRPALRVSAISSSDFGVFLDVAPAAAAFIAVTVERVVALYKQLLEIRQLREGLEAQGVPPDSLAGVDDHANTVMSDGIDAIVEDSMSGRPDHGELRDNELRVELKMSLNAVANRIDQGYNIEVRAKPLPPENSEDESSQGELATEAQLRADLVTVTELAERLHFINRTGRPILSLPESSTSDEGLTDAD